MGVQTIDLRIGNIVQANGPAMIVKAITVHEVELYMPGSEGDYWTEEIEEVTGVKITTDILKNLCGFELLIDWVCISVKVKVGEVDFKLSESKDGFHFITSTGYTPLVKTFIYLHDLQNFFYAFWEYELPISLPDYV